MKKLLLLIPLLMSCSLWQPTGLQLSDNLPTPTSILQGLAEPTPQPGVSLHQVCTVTAAALNVRTGAGTSYQVIGWLYKGDTVTIQSVLGEWLKLDSGWIHGSYCNVSPVQ